MTFFSYRPFFRISSLTYCNIIQIIHISYFYTLYPLYTHRCNLGVAPVYLSELFVLSSSCPGRRSLRSASRGDYLTPHSYMAIKQNRAFSAAGPSLWNGLPFELRSLPRDFSSSFYSLLKTFFFARAWAGSASE